MYSIKLDIEDNILDKVMFFLNNIPKKNIEVTKVISDDSPNNQKIGDFFLKSPLRGEISLSRESQTYDERVSF